MIFFPNCKINIGLSIVEKRKDDGYHNIESIFYPVDLCDVLEIRPNDAKQDCFKISGLDIGNTSAQDNLCIKAVNLLREQYKSIPYLNIHLHKQIPAFAGLGGGSSDATFTLKLLDFLFNLNLTEEQMLSFAAKIGSDCSFFVKNKPTYVFSKGEKSKDITLDLSGYHIVLVKPDLKISTKEAYSNVTAKPSNVDYENLPDIKEWKGVLKNDFEDSLFPKYPVLKQIKDTLYNNGAIYASLSGSGATVYGIFEKEIETERLNLSQDTFIYQGKLK
ncbi:MAG: 4-(cytidine 5'-diphospho)-2-C-methyl-D-erythritol kinase [Bacteroidales bacterium]|nr:4-(cytidine 5'-diphospho)-2-C-methyl-D-erythritol kinase [Bacteroidales bacterium]